MNDKVKITVISGKGGDGAIAFRHEKSVTNGGPFGGNGGKAGDIYFIADNGIDSLSNYRFGKTFKTEDGENGKSKLRYGKDSQDLILHVPVGTVVEDESGKQLADLYKHGDKYLICKGGRGGRGNAMFKSATRRAPNIAENGTPGESKTIYLELKMIADVGLVGYPNVGKSTLICSITNAKSEIGSYQFTTLQPKLGVCFLDDERSFIIADLPGLIDGASMGKGLGISFLRHIERCRVLLHMIDVTKTGDLYKDFLSINNELKNYNSDLLNRKMIIALNKIDECSCRSKIDEFKEKLDGKYDIFEISAKDNINLDKLIDKLYNEVNNAKINERNNIKVLENNEEKVYSAKDDDTGKIPEFNIVKRDDGIFEIIGPRVIKTKRLINLNTDEGVDRLLNYLDRIDVDSKLKEAGAKTGDSVILDDFEFDYYE